MMRSSVLACVLGLVACSGSNSSNNNNQGPDAGSNAGSNTGSNTGSGSAGTGKVPYVIPLTAPDGPIAFYAPMLTVGGQSFAMDLDTGSTSTAIAGSMCTDCSGSGFTISPEYKPSSTATDMMLKADSEFADGTGWYGEVYKDTIGVGNGSPTATIRIVDITTQVDPNDPMAMAGFFADNSYQGILGLGAPENAVQNTDAYFSTIVGTGMPNIMAFELCAGGGTMWLGGVDATHASGPIQYTPLDPVGMTNPFYSIDLTGVSVNGKAIAATTPADLTEWVVDTGTSLFYPPTEFYNGTLTNVQASSGYKTLFGTQKLTPSQTNPNGCVTATNKAVTEAMVNSMLPPFVMTMKNKAGGADLSISAPALDSYLADAGNGQFCLVMGDGGNSSTIGDELLQGFVTVIDLENQQVGWATDSGCPAVPVVRDMTKRFHGPKPHAPRRVIH